VHLNFENYNFGEIGWFLKKFEDFHNFSTANIFTIFENRPFINIADEWEVLYYLSKKFILIGLEFLHQVQLALPLILDVNFTNA